jgi:hypothetical protein
MSFPACTFLLRIEASAEFCMLFPGVEGSHGAVGAGRSQAVLELNDAHLVQPAHVLSLAGRLRVLLLPLRALLRVRQGGLPLRSAWGMDAC